MPSLRLPFVPLDTPAAPKVVDRATWAAACEDLLVREKAESAGERRARRRAPTAADDPGPGRCPGGRPRRSGAVLDAFEGRRLLVGYFHMWHDGRPWDQQCEGCTFFTAQAQRPEYLHSRDVTLAIFCEGTYAESRPYADFVQNRLPWWSAREADGLVGGTRLRLPGLLPARRRRRLRDLVDHRSRHGGHGLELRPARPDRLRPAGELEGSPKGWPQPFGVEASQFRTAGRPTIQWSVTDESVTAGAAHCH